MSRKKVLLNFFLFFAFIAVCVGLRRTSPKVASAEFATPAPRNEQEMKALIIKQTLAQRAVDAIAPASEAAGTSVPLKLPPKSRDKISSSMPSVFNTLGIDIFFLDTAPPRTSSAPTRAPASIQTLRFSPARIYSYLYPEGLPAVKVDLFFDQAPADVRAFIKRARNFRRCKSACTPDGFNFIFANEKIDPSLDLGIYEGFLAISENENAIENSADVLLIFGDPKNVPANYKIIGGILEISADLREKATHPDQKIAMLYKDILFTHKKNGVSGEDQAKLKPFLHLLGSK